MMKKSMLVGIFVVCILLSAPVLNSQKIYTKSILNNNQTNVNDEEIKELKQKIVDRLKELKSQNRPLFSIKLINRTDPDGPLEGGMDDITDIVCFICFIIEFRATVDAGLDFAVEPDFFNFFIFYGFSWSTLVYLGEALDVKEFFMDGK